MSSPVLRAKLAMPGLFDEVSLDLHLGSVLALVGPNGSGKTSLLRGLLDYGEHRARCELSLEDAEYGRQLSFSYLPQSPDYRLELSCAELAALYLEHWLPPCSKPPHEALARWLRHFEASPFFWRRLSTLSGGERRRVELAIALACPTPFLLLDEPTRGLDPRHITLLQNTLRTEGLERGIVVVSHDLAFLEGCATRYLALGPAQGTYLPQALPDVASLYAPRNAGQPL